MRRWKGLGSTDGSKGRLSRRAEGADEALPGHKGLEVEEIGVEEGEGVPGDLTARDEHSNALRGAGEAGREGDDLVQEPVAQVGTDAHGPSVGVEKAEHVVSLQVAGDDRAIGVDDLEVGGHTAVAAGAALPDHRRSRASVGFLRGGQARPVGNVVDLATQVAGEGRGPR